MSLIDRIKSFFSGGSSTADPHAGHEHAPEPTAPTMPTDPAGMPTSEPAEPGEREDERGNAPG
jgi:hypothetical protein